MNIVDFIKKAFDKSFKSSVKVKLDSALLTRTCHACNMYLNCMQTLTTHSMDVMAGLCFKDLLCSCLWKLINDLGPNYALKLSVEASSGSGGSSSSSDASRKGQHLLVLLKTACDVTSHVIS